MANNSECASLLALSVQGIEQFLCERLLKAAACCRISKAKSSKMI
jgi:hypothetical protein